MDFPARILSIGDDENLLISRELILRKQGYEVASIASNEFLRTTPAGSFDVAVVSQSVVRPRASQVVEALKRNYPEIRILRIQPLRSSSEEYYDLDCEAFSSPSAFLAAVGKLCVRNQSAVKR